jgi:hypothetical protein
LYNGLVCPNTWETYAVVNPLSIKQTGITYVLIKTVIYLSLKTNTGKYGGSGHIGNTA